MTWLIPNGMQLRTVSLRIILLGTGLALAAVCAAMALTTARAMTTASFYLERASSSYQQLVFVTRLEADVNALLLDEAARRLDPATSTVAAVTPPDIEQLFAVYMASIRSEADKLRDQDDKASETSELVLAQELRDIFRAIQADFSSYVAKDLTSPDMRDVRDLIARRVAEMRQRIHRIVEGEQDEVSGTMRAMTQLSDGLWVKAATIAGFTVLGLPFVFLYLNRSLIQPIEALSAGTGRFGRGELETRVVACGAMELRNLAVQFNEMAIRLAAQKNCSRKATNVWRIPSATARTNLRQRPNN